MSSEREATYHFVMYKAFNCCYGTHRKMTGLTQQMVIMKSRCNNIHKIMSCRRRADPRFVTADTFSQEQTQIFKNRREITTAFE